MGMNLDVNQSNLYLLLPGKVAWITEMLIDDMHLDIVEAVKKVYSSNTYRMLEKESTKMWHLGPVALYQDMARDS